LPPFKIDHRVIAPAYAYGRNEEEEENKGGRSQGVPKKKERERKEFHQSTFGRHIVAITIEHCKTPTIEFQEGMTNKFTVRRYAIWDTQRPKGHRRRAKKKNKKPKRSSRGHVQLLQQRLL
jgi:hypothetical protein